MYKLIMRGALNKGGFFRRHLLRPRPSAAAPATAEDKGQCVREIGSVARPRRGRALIRDIRHPRAK